MTSKNTVHSSNVEDLFIAYRYRFDPFVQFAATFFKPVMKSIAKGFYAFILRNGSLFEKFFFCLTSSIFKLGSQTSQLALIQCVLKYEGKYSRNH